MWLDLLLLFFLLYVFFFFFLVLFWFFCYCCHLPGKQASTVKAEYQDPVPWLCDDHKLWNRCLSREIVFVRWAIEYVFNK